MQVMYLGRAPHTKESLPDFLKWCRVTRHPLVFRGLTGSQRAPGNEASHSTFPLYFPLYFISLVLFIFDDAFFQPDLAGAYLGRWAGDCAAAGLVCRLRIWHRWFTVSRCGISLQRQEK